MTTVSATHYTRYGKQKQMVLFHQVYRQTKQRFLRKRGEFLKSANTCWKLGNQVMLE